MCQHDLSRRSFLRAGTGLAVAAALGGCSSSPDADRGPGLGSRASSSSAPGSVAGSSPHSSESAVPGATAASVPSEPAPPGATTFHPLAALRIVDTAGSDGWVRIDGRRIRIPIVGRGGVPDRAVAAALRVTGIGPAGGTAISVVPAGAAAVDGIGPASSCTVFSLLADGAVDVLHDDPDTVVAVDVLGYFEPAATASGAGRMVGIEPATMLDTAASASPLAPGETRPIRLDPPAGLDAVAAVVHLTATAANGSWTVGPADGGTVSVTLLTGAGHGVTATTVVPLGSGGVGVTSLAGGHVSVDVVAYVTGSAAPVSVEGLFVPVPPSRVLDTRTVRQPVPDGSSREVALGPERCGALAVNVATVAVGGDGSTTVWDAGGAPRREVGRVAQGPVGTATSHHAVAPAGRRGIAIGSWGGQAHVVVDLHGWFVGERSTTREPVLGAQPYGIASIDMESHAEEWLDYGRSTDGRPLRAFRHGAGPRTGLLTTGIHGDELTGTSVLADLVTHEPIAGWTLWLVPIANPDARAALTRFVRDVDMNRDFPVDWSRLPDPTPSGCVTTRTGPSPLSLVESQRLAAAMLDGPFRGATVSVSHHDNYNWVAPQSGSPAALRELADAYATATGLRLPGENGSIVPTSPRTTNVRGGFETFAQSLGMSSFLVENRAGYVAEARCAGAFGVPPDPAAVAPHHDALRALLTDGRLPA